MSPADSVDFENPEEVPEKPRLVERLDAIASGKGRDEPMLRAGNRVGRDVERLMRDGIDPSGGDGSLLRRFLENRDESAFETIVDRHGPLVLSLCKRYLREPADVEDAFQATFLVLVRKGAGLCEAETLAGWLHGVAHRVAFRARSDVLKRRSREGERDGVQEATAALAQPDDDSLRVLDGELAKLPEKFRAPLILCYLRGRTHDQAAAELGWPVGTVRSRMAKARSILHDRLSRRGLDASACLAAARLDLAATVVPSSLVAATGSAAGRFAALAAGLGWIWRASPSSTTWPAAALAQGVLSTMSTTPWKLLGFAFLSTGLTAGAVAFASGPPMSSPKQDEPPKPQSPSEAKTAPQPGESSGGSVEARLAEVEKKLDRLLQAIEKPSAVAQPPASSSVVEPPAPRSIDPKGLREIEAELINNYQRYSFTLKLVERQVVSKSEMDMVVGPVRLLVARLRDMEDESKRDENKAEAAIGLIERRRDIANLEHLREKLKGEAKAASETIQASGVSTEEFDKAKDDPDARSKLATRGIKVSKALSAYEQAQENLHAVENNLGKLRAGELRTNQQLDDARSRTLAIQKLIKWARDHFKDVELTIEDAVKAK